MCNEQVARKSNNIPLTAPPPTDASTTSDFPLSSKEYSEDDESEDESPPTRYNDLSLKNMAPKIEFDYPLLNTRPFTFLPTPCRTNDEKKPPATDDAPDVCLTAECKLLAIMAMSAMDSAQNPCSNFYQFACGGLNQHQQQFRITPIQVEEDVRKRISNVLQTIDDHSPTSWQLMKKFYQQCLHNNQGGSGEDDLLDHIRSAVELIAKSNDVTSLLGEMMLHHSTPVFDVDIADDAHFQLTPPHRDSLLGHSIVNDLSAIRKLDIFKDEKQLSSSLEIYNQLSQWLPHKGKLRRLFDLKQNYTIMTVREMMEYWKGIDWQSLFNRLTGTDVSLDEPVRVYVQTYINKVVKILTTEDKLDVHNALLSYYASQIYGELRTTGQCQTTTATLMEDVNSNIYLSTFNQDKRKTIGEKLVDIFGNLQATMKDLSEDWPGDEKLHESILQKVQSIRLDVNNTVFTMLSSNELDDKWSDFRLGNNYAESVLRLVERYRKSFYDDKAKSREDGVSLSRGSAIYALNKVVIPFGMVGSGQLYSDKHPAYWNMAKIGYLMAREMMHHFDQTGIAHHGLEQMNASQEYSQVMHRIRQKVSTMSADPQEAVNEMYAEEEGIKLSWETYVRRISLTSVSEMDDPLPWLNMTDAQLFFLASAQVHCGLDRRDDDLPGRLRVSALVSHSVGFARAYQCQTVQTEPEPESAVIASTGDSSLLDQVKAMLTTTTEMIDPTITEIETESEDSTE